MRFQPVIWRISLHSKASQVCRTNHSASILQKGTNRRKKPHDQPSSSQVWPRIGNFHAMGRCLIFGSNQWQFVSTVPDLPSLQTQPKKKSSTPSDSCPRSLQSLPPGGKKNNKTNPLPKKTMTQDNSISW